MIHSNYAICNFREYLMRRLWVLGFISASLFFAHSAVAEDKLDSGEAWVSRINSQITNIGTNELLDFLQHTPATELLDVRLLEEIASQGGLINAGRRTHHIPRGWIEHRIGETIPDLNTPIVVYCSTNRRSPLVAFTLQQMGYTNVKNYTDGFLAWVEEGHSVDATDEAVGTQLFRKTIEVAPSVYSAIGAAAPATFENSGHNNNLSFVVSNDGVLVVNAGDNYLLASALHDEIKERTDQPVKYVVLENAQGHAMLGMNYWQEQGAQVIAHKDAADVISSTGEATYQRMLNRNRDKAMGTAVSAPDRVFDDKLILLLGETEVQLLYLGPAHSPGDISVWLPEQRIVIAGDMAFHERLLPVFEYTDTYAWIETWDSFAALDPLIVVPGHGHPTTLDVVGKWTIGYLEHMRNEIGNLLDEGGSLIEAYKIDQSAYSHLDTFDELAGLNADRIYRAMEFE